MWLLHTLFEFSEVKFSVTLYMGDRMQTWWLMGYPPLMFVMRTVLKKWMKKKPWLSFEGAHSKVDLYGIVCCHTSPSCVLRETVWHCLLSHRSSAAHLIAEFTKKALLKDLPQVSEPPSPTVIGAYLYVCRQLYNTCEGLLVLYPYDLHTCVAQAWREVS